MRITGCRVSSEPATHSRLIVRAGFDPAIFAITPDPFIVFASNILAMLGLRSLSFLLDGAISSLHYLEACWFEDAPVRHL
jgi:Integral membrane protein TerC family